MSSQHDLVSIIIVTYNSSEYVIDTLESCLNQTYVPIEIIISDDGSTDNTLELCHAWKKNIATNKNINIITSNERRGIPANCNRGANAANGQWLKFLGADDILKLDAIQNLINATDANTDLVFSKFETFGENIRHSEIFPYSFTWNLIKSAENCWDKKREWLFLLGFSNVAPGAFIRSSAFHALGGYDESYYLLEDLPLWYKLFSENYKVKHCESITVCYRIHLKQATSFGISPLLKKDLLKFTSEKRKKYFIPYWHNRFQIYILSNKRISKLKYINIFQWLISLYNRFF
ncbi:glycosyltransferase family 2 protein [Dryocola clanedunensis]